MATKKSKKKTAKIHAKKKKTSTKASKKLSAKKTSQRASPNKATKKKASKPASAVKANAFPRAPFECNRTAITNAYADLRSALVKDPLFIEEAADFGVSIEELDRKMKNPPADLGGENLWEWLDGADQYRYAALAVLLRAHGGGPSTKLGGRVCVSDEETVIATGDVAIDGDLVLGTQAMLVVLGQLSVTGSIVGNAFDYSMIAARAVRCRAGTTGGEVIALERIVADKAFYFSGNDYSARAPLFEGGVLVDFERGNAFTKTKVKKRVTEWDFGAAAKALGVRTEDDLADGYALSLLGEA